MTTPSQPEAADIGGNRTTRLLDNQIRSLRLMHLPKLGKHAATSLAAIAPHDTSKELEDIKEGAGRIKDQSHSMMGTTKSLKEVGDRAATLFANPVRTGASALAGALATSLSAISVPSIILPALAATTITGTAIATAGLSLAVPAAVAGAAGVVIAVVALTTRLDQSKLVLRRASLANTRRTLYSSLSQYAAAVNAHDTGTDSKMTDRVHVAAANARQELTDALLRNLAGDAGCVVGLTKHMNADGQVSITGNQPTDLGEASYELLSAINTAGSSLIDIWAGANDEQTEGDAGGLSNALYLLESLKTMLGDVMDRRLATLRGDANKQRSFLHRLNNNAADLEALRLDNIKTISETQYGFAAYRADAEDPATASKSTVQMRKQHAKLAARTLDYRKTVANSNKKSNLYAANPIGNKPLWYVPSGLSTAAAPSPDAAPTSPAAAPSPDAAPTSPAAASGLSANSEPTPRPAAASNLPPMPPFGKADPLIQEKKSNLEIEELQKTAAQLKKDIKDIAQALELAQLSHADLSKLLSETEKKMLEAVQRSVTTLETAVEEHSSSVAATSPSKNIPPV
jgi:hypothetical protein